MPTTSINPNHDTWIAQDTPTTNRGSAGWMRQTNTTSAASAKKCFFRFDLSSIPADATINSATFKVYKYTGLTRAKCVGVNNNSDDTSWTESMTWNTMLNHDNSAGDVAFTNGETTYDSTNTGSSSAEFVTFDVQAWVDARKGDSVCSLALIAANNSGGTNPRYRTFEHGTSSERPVLDIDYTEASGYPVHQHFNSRR